jgi:protease-4
VYDGFVQRVAAGRGRPTEQVEPHCRGRVWTGHAAFERGLVDERGDLERAVERAAALAGVPVGAIRRRDLAAHREPFWARWLQAMVRQAIPAASVAGRALSSGRALDLFLRHEGQALTLFPYDLDVR